MVNPSQANAAESHILIAEAIGSDAHPAAEAAARNLEAAIAKRPEDALAITERMRSDLVRPRDQTVNGVPKNQESLTERQQALDTSINALLAATANGRHIYFSDEVYDNLKGKPHYEEPADQIRNIRTRRQPERLEFLRKQIILCGLGAIAMFHLDQRINDQTMPTESDGTHEVV